MPMMTSQILYFVGSPKAKESTYPESETLVFLK